MGRSARNLRPKISKIQQTARRDLHYVRARRCDASAARAEPWHAMVPLMHVYTAKYTIYIAILYLQVLIVEVHLYLLVLMPIPSFKIWEHPREAKKCNVVSTRSTIKSCAVLERRYLFISTLVYMGAGPTAAEAQFQLSRTL